MKNENYKKEGNKWNLVEELKRYRNICYVCKLIYEYRECIVSEIIKETGICKSTLYNYIDKAVDAGLVIKNFDSEIHKNGAQFTVVALPALETFLKKFKRTILEFSQFLSEL
ncbi:MAG: hypothetical protein V3V33_06500 [Candidatus Lokiarchaeia archaeon]